MMARKLVLLPIGAVLLLVVPATASAATFTVNEFGDESDADLNDGRCDHDLGEDGKQCTLRAATQEANVAASSRDKIDFAPTVVGDTIFAPSNFAIDTPMVIDGGDCPEASIPHAPCVGVDNNGGGVLFNVDEDVDDVTIKGLSMTGTINGFPAVAVRQGASRFKLRNSWLGIDLDQNADGNDKGVALEEANDAVIGGTRGKDRNVFAHNDIGLDIAGSDRGKVRGNYFGVEPDGTTPAPSVSEQIKVQADPSTDNVIGASIDSSHRATTKCDGGCNVIAGAGTNGITDAGQGTTIKGNFIGLDATGQTAAENQDFGIDVIISGDATIGGDTSADRNFITGGSSGIRFNPSTPAGIVVKRNFIGLNSAGSNVESPPASNGILMEDSTVPDPTVVSRNRIGGASGDGIDIEGEGARVVRNKIGVGRNNVALPGPSLGIRVNTSAARIGEPGAGNTVGNTTGPAAIQVQATGGSVGDGNRLQGNLVGVDSSGGSHPNVAVGILLSFSGDAVNDNIVGGTSAETENVISNSGGDAIALTDGTLASSGNQIKRNRGKNNGDVNTGDLFIDLGSNGVGNPGQNGDIDPPALADTDPGDTTRSHTEGTCEGDDVYIFRTSNADGDAPNRINAFVKMVPCGMTGTFSANFSKIPSGQSLTALNLDTVDGSSELATAVAPPGP